MRVQAEALPPRAREPRFSITLQKPASGGDVGISRRITGYNHRQPNGNPTSFGVEKNATFPHHEHLTQEQLDHWANAPRRIHTYESDTLVDGTPYKGGRILFIGNPKKGEEQQVMDDFEKPWVAEVVNQMWYGKYHPQRAANRGFGLGLMDNGIHEKMKKAGGQHVIIELNKQVYEDAQQWALGKLAEAQASGRALRFITHDYDGNVGMWGETTHKNNDNMIEIAIINGDADKELDKFPSQYFDLIYSDTHQIVPDHIGIHDILEPEALAAKLKPNGRFAFLQWHRNNEAGQLNDEQLKRVRRGFRKFNVSSVAEVVVPPHSEYLTPGVKVLDVVTCSIPWLN